MLAVLAQMSLLIACGTFWKTFAPAHISASAHRRALTDLVFYILLPALVLNVIWSAPLDHSSLQISFLAACGILIGMTTMWLVLKWLKASRQQTGALLLAAAFPNATYLGLPVLNQVLGPHSRVIVLQYDLFACTPILLSFGMLLAQHFGDNKSAVHPLHALLKIPPLWAVTVGISLNLAGIPQPEILDSGLSMLAGGVVPLMLIVLGMSIRWHSLRLRFMGLLLPVALITLVLTPFCIFGLSQVIGLTTELIIPVALISAMPTMVFGIVICERYGLDSELYAAAVTLTTICSLVTLPLWFHWLSVS
ncbi:hypothetical protein LCGC14_0440790 [marine sediment metagenome]|uniref:Auxin efflux carrier n=1 Tax=marine sediment metagenome TaxID=412755 RepID=A0A0F9T3M0_9ZZZZ|nr:AEC family transporter [Methylophaga sp.]HEC60590.1 AEC family transporter [Methylophaga sp.]